MDDVIFYDLEYALRRLNDAIDYAEIEMDFIGLRKWYHEVKQTSLEIEKELNNIRV